jgi:hypothetical protein
VRYNERSAAERVNGHLKDDFGGRYVRVRGHAKVFCHLTAVRLTAKCVAERADLTWCCGRKSVVSI